MADDLRLFQAMAGAKLGGAEAFFERFTEAIERRGIAQRVAIRRDADRSARLRNAGVDVLEFAYAGPLDVATRLGLARALRAFEPTI
ncbi:MAG: glycosyltransferase, partial [Alphaproteobacteria bacterium]|nr:glycosyltransferase [Alphaproteobacteria bacterium]